MHAPSMAAMSSSRSSSCEESFPPLPSAPKEGILKNDGASAYTSSAAAYGANPRRVVDGGSR